MQKITAKIKEVSLIKEEKAQIVELVPKTLHEGIKRPEILTGTTYKIKSPHHDDAVYVTINDITLNANTENEEKRPFEIFINSKAMESQQWIVALTRTISAIFRKGGDVTFLVEEMTSVHTPQGGYWKQGKWMNSLVAEIGFVIKDHLVTLGMIEAEQSKTVVEGNQQIRGSMCPKCGAPALVKSGGCDTCLNCGASKCE